jgi:hypothetical protein
MPFGTGQATSTTGAYIVLPYPVQPRVSPTGVANTSAGSFYLTNSGVGVAGTFNGISFQYASLNALWISCSTTSGLVAGNATLLGTNTAPAQILATGCEL